jgi:hypothetical protein
LLGGRRVKMYPVVVRERAIEGLGDKVYMFPLFIFFQGYLFWFFLEVRGEGRRQRWKKG